MINEIDNPETLELSLTDDAIEQVKRLLTQQKREGHGLRVAVADGGCSGYSYKLDFESNKNPKMRYSSATGLRFSSIAPARLTSRARSSISSLASTAADSNSPILTHPALAVAARHSRRESANT